MKNIFLVRHSIAESIQVGKKDFDRELTQTGKDILLSELSKWKIFIKDARIIYSSPYKRALQTAEIISSSFEPKINIVTDNNLASGCKTADLIEIANNNGFENQIFVGHQPDISYHIKNLCSNGNLNLEIPPATLSLIKFNGKVRYSAGSLALLIPPEI